jgi:hypothetical protein
MNPSSKRNTMKVIRFLSAIAGLLSVFTLSSCTDSVCSPQYYSPLQNAEYVSTTIIFRPANPFTPGEQVMVHINSLRNEITLGYSWNGATEVAAYRVFSGNSSQSLGLIEEKAKTECWSI